jgi:hypothetical protein
VLLNSRKPAPIILHTAFIQFQGGLGKITCLNEEITAWYRQEVEQINLNGITFKAWGQNKMGGLHPAHMVHAGLEEISPKECIKLITAYTPGLQG